MLSADSQSPDATAKARENTVKADLTLDLIKRLTLDRRPVGLDSKGKLVFEGNPDGKDYIVWDSSKSAPPGFGVRVAGKKTYVIRRKIHGRSIMPTVGNCADFKDVAEAREKAAALALRMRETGTNPNAEARRVAASEITLGQAFDNYRNHLTTRAHKRAKPNTLRVFDRAKKRFEDAGWLNRRVRNLAPDEILSKFKERMAAFPTANEANFRWASVSVRYAIDLETLAAEAGRRPATLTANPFSILYLKGMFRDRATLERIRDEKMKRNPLGPTTTLGPFLEAAWSKKNSNDNETGVHYLMLMLLWGGRTNEHASCVWGELLTPAERRRASHVWLREDGEYGSHVFFHDTKNGRNHRLPLGPMVRTLLARRQESAAREAAERGFDKGGRSWVFPAKSRFSKSGHYASAQDLLGRLRDEIGLERLSRHDLRRSFGAVMVSLDVPDGIRTRFLNHAAADVTETYTQAEWALLREWMGRMEQAMFVQAPNVYNSLKPVEWPPLPAPAPHVCKPAKPRTGRPRKAPDDAGGLESADDVSMTEGSPT
jgi:hypothetical protein